MIRKIIALLAVLLLGAAGWYFLYWEKTPAYAAGEIQQAVQKKDYQLFRERVDMDKVYGSAVDDLAAYLSDSGKPDRRLAASLLKGLKKEAVGALKQYTEKQFRSGESGDSLIDRSAQKITAYIGSGALSLTDILSIEEKDGKAVAAVKLHDKKLNKDFTWQVLLERDINGTWTATKVLNLKEYLREREEAGA